MNQRSQIPASADNWPMPISGSEKSPRKSNQPNQAIEAYRQAQAIWEPLVAAHPDDHELQGHLAESYLAVGKLQNTVANLDLDGAIKIACNGRVRSWSRSRRRIRARRVTSRAWPTVIRKSPAIQARRKSPARAWSSSRKPKPSRKA